MAGYTSTHTGAEIDAYATKQQLINLIYPVGSIYISVNSTSPATLFGGTWEQIQDKFLLSAGNSYTAGSTGGTESHVHSTANHTLTINETPRHAHRVYLFNNNNTSFNAKFYNDSGTAYQTTYGGRIQTYLRWQDAAFKTAGNDGLGDLSGNTTINGGGAAHNHGNTGSTSNMPPYLTVYMWKRTA